MWVYVGGFLFGLKQIGFLRSLKFLNGYLILNLFCPTEFNLIYFLF